MTRRLDRPRSDLVPPQAQRRMTVPRCLGALVRAGSERASRGPSRGKSVDQRRVCGYVAAALAVGVILHAVHPIARARYVASWASHPEFTRIGREQRHQQMQNATMANARHLAQDLPADYPSSYESVMRLADGRRVKIRPILPSDAPELAEAIRTADAETLRARFLGGPPPSQTPHCTH
jgi:hypothetical protein